MGKAGRGARVAAMVGYLTARPGRLVPYARFCERYGASRSTVSEDVAIAGDALREQGLGRLETVLGAAGGVRFLPCADRASDLAFVSGLCERLCDPDRSLPGGYLYLSDILADPVILRRLGAILACSFYTLEVDFVLTMETKGIPIALMTADALGVPLVIARRSTKVYEGSSVNISFPNGKGVIETMSLARRLVRPGQRTLIVDDFIRDGGTALGMVSLMKEFSVEVAGLAFMLAQEKPQRRLVMGERSLMLFSGDGESGPLTVRPAVWLSREDD